MSWRYVSHYHLNRAHLTMTKPKQIDKFQQMAKEFECDESEKAFDKKLKRMVKNKTENE